MKSHVWVRLRWRHVCVSFRENLERLLDDKHFKEEIVHFNISEETGVVDASHRARLIPLLMRYYSLSTTVPWSRGVSNTAVDTVVESGRVFFSFVALTWFVAVVFMTLRSDTGDWLRVVNLVRQCFFIRLRHKKQWTVSCPVSSQSVSNSLIIDLFSQASFTCFGLNSTLSGPGSFLDVCAAKQEVSSRANPRQPPAPPSFCVFWPVAKRRSWRCSSASCWSRCLITAKVEKKERKHRTFSLDTFYFL